MKYTYFPGCAVKTTANPYEQSIQAVAQVVGIGLEELEDWNCCGASSYLCVDELLSFCLSGRNLARAQRQATQLVTPCSGCYAVLRKADSYYHSYPSVRQKMQEALAAGGLTYDGGVKVRHLLDVMVNDVGLETIASSCSSPLSGLRVAPYYGCQLTRPRDGADDTEFLGELDRLVETLGAEPVQFPMKTSCCGGSLMASQPDVACQSIYELLLWARWSDAQCIVTACPLCHANLEFFQPNVNRAYKTHFNMPVLYFTQLMGLAMGVPPSELGLNRSIISTGGLLKANL